MAEKKGRKTTAGKKASARKTYGRKRSAGRQAKASEVTSARDNQVRRDVRVLVFLVICILIFISCVGAGGAVGRAFSSFFFGMFGLMAYIFPFILFYLVLFITANEMSGAAAARVISLIGVFVCVCAFIHLILYGDGEGQSVADIYRECAMDKSGGGIVGGGIDKLCGTGFGTAGAYVIVLAGLVIFTIILAQKPILSAVKARGEYAYDTRGERIAAWEERRAERQQKRDAARAEREHEEKIRELHRRRAAQAREQAAAARAVVPQTIAANGKVTAVSGSGVSPITAENSADLAAEKRNGSDAARKQKNIFDSEPGAEDPLISGSAERTGPVTAADIPDEIIESSAAPAADGMPDTIIPGQRAAEATASAAPGTEVPDKKRPLGGDDSWTDGNRSEGTGFAEAGSRRSSGLQAADQTEETGAVAQDGPDASVGAEEKAPRKGKPSVGKVEEIEVPEQQEIREYVPPSLDLLSPPDTGQTGDSREYLKKTAAKLQETLHTFGVEVTINHISCGPSVTRFELIPQMGVKVSKIMSLQDDIKLNLAATDVRIEAPIPGKAAIGIEVPNKKKTTVNLRELLSTDAFRKHKSKLAFAVGKDIAGQPVIADLAKMPHLLIAGATGSGKSVFINTLIMSLIYKSRPDEVKFIMVDPKVVELSVYNGIPHLLIPVVTDPKKAAGALNWAVQEMTDRYQRFAELGARDLKSYNAKVDAMPEPETGEKPKKMYRIVVIVDELADLMMVAQNEVEDSICRLAQLARAAGIHLVIATQRPSVNVITGLIKANMPSRIALSVSSGVDSRTIIDMNGAEKLLGNGDMLFYPQGYQKPARVQGAFLSDEDIARVVKFLKDNHTGSYVMSAEIQNKIENSTSGSTSPSGDAMDTDEYFTDAGKLIIEKDKASIGMLQRAFRIGFNRAARIMDQLCDAGVVGAEEGTKPRKILMTMEEFENYLEENG